MALSAAHKKFLFVDQSLIPGVFNFLINGLIAWLIFRAAETTTLWGEGSFGSDLLITALLLPALTALIVSPIIVKQVKNGKLLPLPESHKASDGMAAKPTILRALLLGVLGILFAALPIIFLLDMIQDQAIVVQLASNDYALFKAVWAALMAILITPVIAWWALQSAS
jgi:hypothetical protein